MAVLPCRLNGTTSRRFTFGGRIGPYNAASLCRQKLAFIISARCRYGIDARMLDASLQVSLSLQATPCVVQELHRALHRSLHRATGDELVAPLSSLTSSLPLTVEHRDKRGKLQLLGEGDIAKLSDLDTLYVTISISSPAAGDDKDSDCDDNGSEVLVDLSLSGCCGIRSTYGGLVVTGCAGSSSSPQREKRNEQGGARPGHNCLG
mmetsp:Transcript_1347/g.3810  ORF Transcript_1347/g.3810 Transcript_1347/m.3810 type:complete len:206 (+) Transcript_1347:556-1173(+)